MLWVSLWVCAALAAKTPIVFVSTIQPKPTHDVLIYPAKVVPKISANLVADIDGIVSRVNAPLGTPVKRGQVVLVLKHTDPVYDYVPLKVRAPVAGVVAQVDVSEGSQITRGQKLATVTDPSQIRLVVEAPAADPAARRSIERPEMAEAAGRARSIIQALGHLRTQIAALATLPFGEHHARHSKQVLADLENAQKGIKWGIPATPCPHCGGKPARCEPSQLCEGLGWIPEGAMVNLTSEDKAACERLAANVA
jgi:multidrug efflux pump subunit AcrA (membrane-fusion protein)